MKYYFTFFPPSVVFFRYLSISKVGHISKHFYLYYYTLLGNITYINFNYLFLMRTILKYVSLLLSIPLFFYMNTTWESPLLRIKTKLICFSPNLSAFLYYLSHLIEPISIRVRGMEVVFESFLSLSSPLLNQPWNPKYFWDLCISLLIQVYIIFIRLISEFPYLSLCSPQVLPPPAVSVF